MIDTSRAFGTVLTVGAGVIALNMVSRLGETVMKDKSKPYSPMYKHRSYVPMSFDIKPLKWKL